MSTKIGKYRLALKQIEDEIEELETKKTRLIEKMHAKCEHPNEEILEVRYHEYKYDFGIDRPFRVCKACGYAEEGWGCGYKKLERFGVEFPTISREQAFFEYVVKYYSQDELYD